MGRKIKIILAVIVLTVVSCKDDKVEDPIPEIKYVRLTMQPVFGSSELSLNDTITTAEGYKVQFTDLKCYFSSLKNGSNELTQSALFDYASRGIEVFKVPGDPAKFASLTGFLGVDPNYNHDDPSAFPNNSPLNIMNANDMHWDWNPGYIFIKVEAKVDTNPDAITVLDHFVNFHIGTDQFLQNLSFSGLNWSDNGSGVYTAPLRLDLEKFLQNGAQIIDLKTEYTSHTMSGQELLSEKVIQNFATAISVY
ncbi:MAG: MbnP family protein [Flavobacteriia bacterium]|jgi:hypothetical protein